MYEGIHGNEDEKPTEKCGIFGTAKILLYARSGGSAVVGRVTESKISLDDPTGLKHHLQGHDFPSKGGSDYIAIRATTITVKFGILACPYTLIDRKGYLIILLTLCTP